MPTVLITGASKGLGKELLKIYLHNKWKVFPLVREKNLISEIISSYKNQCFPIIGDITSENIKNRITTVLKTHSRSLDVLINNAGNIKKNRGLINTTVDDLQELFDVHCKGVFVCIKTVLPFLRNAPNPKVINITSRWGSIQRTANGKGNAIYSYNIAKAAQNMLTAILHQELKDINISVYAVHPGKLLTSIAAADADTPPEIAADRLFHWINNIPDDLNCQLYDLMNDSVIEW
ncbi:hypothetical protein B6I21_08630 [candidate division KSB1 bacterium 4572_119]|nr:MAG: hypothetical protein B6I21_08630 [candidate division KSB1 bacterium 4572_119]